MTMATTEFTTASPSEVTPAQIASLQNAPYPDDAIASSFVYAQPAHPQSSPPASFKPRQLKIGYLPQAHESVPFLRMSGKWLAQAGFEIGSDVRITVASQRLVIEAKPPECKSKNQIRNERRAALKNVADHDHRTIASIVSPTFADVQRVHEAASNQHRSAHPCQNSTAASSPAPSERASSRTNSKALEARLARGTWPERLRATLEPALGDLLFKERSRLNLLPVSIAKHAQVNESSYRALDRGDRQPNLSTFIAIAWTLDQDPRELFDKLLLQMGFPSGTRPVISPLHR